MVADSQSEPDLEVVASDQEVEIIRKEEEQPELVLAVGDPSSMRDFTPEELSETSTESGPEPRFLVQLGLKPLAHNAMLESKPVEFLVFKPLEII